MEVLSPKGDIGAQEKNLILISLGLMLLVVIPVIVMTLVFAWRYRASNTKAHYAPKWAHSTAIEAVVWTIPCIIVAILGVLAWRSTHSLDPYQPLDSTVKPVRVEAVALDWKWLFIYPDYGVATVNELSFPVGTPVDFKVTADGVMNSFFIPQLGTQIYAMAGMQTQLHLIASEAGNYAGISSNFSGPGFSDMHFQALVTSQQGFDDWIKHAKASTTALDATSYQALAKPSERNAVTYYGTVSPTMFNDIVDKYMVAPPAKGMAMSSTMDMNMHNTEAKAAE